MIYIINLLGGPGIGKSTIASGLFHLLKLDGIEAELILEFAKDKVYEQNIKTLDNQFFVTANQHHRLWRVINYWKSKNVKKGIIVTDSPFILGLMYLKDSPSAQKFKEFVLTEFETFNNINILLERKKDYNPVGRLQSEKEAKEIDIKIRKLLKENNIYHISVESSPLAAKHIFDYLKDNAII